MRIREPHIQNIAKKRSGYLDQDEETTRAHLLRERLIANLSDPDVELTGHTLPDDGYPIESTDPATNLPDDTSADVVEALVRTYTDKEDSVGFLFGRSMTPVEIAEELDRTAVLVDPYADHLCCHTSGDIPRIHRAAWDPGTVVDALTDVRPDMECFDLLVVHLPAPGVVNRRQFLYPNIDPPLHPIHWEGLDLNSFFARFKGRIRQWGELVERGGHIAVLSTPSQFDPAQNQGSEMLMHPCVATHMAELGWTRTRHHPVYREPGDVPIQKPVLTRANVTVYRRHKEGT